MLIRNIIVNELFSRSYSKLYLYTRGSQQYSSCLKHFVNWQQRFLPAHLPYGRHLWVSQVAKFSWLQKTQRNATQLSATNNFTPHATCHTRRLSLPSDQIQHQHQVDCIAAGARLSLLPAACCCSLRPAPSLSFSLALPIVMANDLSLSQDLRPQQQQLAIVPR